MTDHRKSEHQVTNILNPSVFVTNSTEKTRELGRKLSKHLKPGDVIYLKGELGSGKTTFVQGLATGLGIKENVRSSSFVLANEYKSAKAKFFHIDLYRLEDMEFDNIGIEEYIFGDGICVIEWADKFKKYPASSYYEVSFEWSGENKRKIEIRKQN